MLVCNICLMLNLFFLCMLGTDSGWKLLGWLFDLLPWAYICLLVLWRDKIRSFLRGNLFIQLCRFINYIPHLLNIFDLYEDGAEKLSWVFEYSERAFKVLYKGMSFSCSGVFVLSKGIIIKLVYLFVYLTSC